MYMLVGSITASCPELNIFKNEHVQNNKTAALMSRIFLNRFKTIPEGTTLKIRKAISHIELRRLAEPLGTRFPLLWSTLHSRVASHMFNRVLIAFLLVSSVAFAGVTVTSPTPGTTTASPVRF